MVDVKILSNMIVIYSSALLKYDIYCYFGKLLNTLFKRQFFDIFTCLRTCQTLIILF